MQPTEKIKISVVIAAKNEEKNIDRCLNAIRGWAEEIFVIDSQSTDGTCEIAESYGANVVQFHYKGGWPKKRQWALENINFKNEWILVLDADEILTATIRQEIAKAIENPDYDAYYLSFAMIFLGRQLRYGDTMLMKLVLFRHAKAQYEKRLGQQDASMADMEIHEHIVHKDTGKVGYIKTHVPHENFNTLDRYIEKHNAYSNWEANVHLRGSADDLKPSLWGTQAQRRRWLKTHCRCLPGSPILRFIYNYIICLGFLDGKAGLIYSMFKAVQMFHIKAKIYELKMQNETSTTTS